MLTQNEFGSLLSNCTFIDIYGKIWAMFKTPQTKNFFYNVSQQRQFGNKN